MTTQSLLALPFSPALGSGEGEVDRVKASSTAVNAAAVAICKIGEMNDFNASSIPSARGPSLLPAVAG